MFTLVTKVYCIVLYCIVQNIDDDIDFRTIAKPDVLTRT